jgi:hypothetical protein
MAFEQDLAASVRTALAGAGAVREVKMFGGIGFMLNGNLVAGAPPGAACSCASARIATPMRSRSPARVRW